MRSVLIALCVTVSAYAAETSYPHWDGQESIEQYAKRANLPPTKTFDLGDSVRLELVLIPAGKFTMGTEEPPPVYEEALRDKIQMGQIALTLSGGLLLVMLAFVLIRAIREKHRPQVSLARLLLLALIAGTGLLADCTGTIRSGPSPRPKASTKRPWRDSIVRIVMRSRRMR